MVLHPYIYVCIHIYIPLEISGLVLHGEIQESYFCPFLGKQWSEQSDLIHWMVSYCIWPAACACENGWCYGWGVEVIDVSVAADRVCRTETDMNSRRLCSQMWASQKSLDNIFLSQQDNDLHSMQPHGLSRWKYAENILERPSQSLHHSLGCADLIGQVQE